MIWLKHAHAFILSQNPNSLVLGIFLIFRHFADQNSIYAFRFIIFLIFEIIWSVHESEAFLGKASKGEGVARYFEPLGTQHKEASGSPNGWNLMRKIDSHRFLHMGSFKIK